MLTQTCKSLKTYLYSTSSEKLWTKAGEQFCGRAYWPQIDKTLPHWKNPRTGTMLRVCPWISEPRKFEVSIINSIGVFGGKCRVKAMDVNGAQCVFRVEIDGTDSAFFKNWTTQAYLHCNAYNMSEQQQEHASRRTWPPFKAYRPSEEELLLVEELKQEKWRPDAMYPDRPIQFVRIVHEGLLCVICHNSSSANMADIYFVSTHTRSVLHTHRYF